MFSLKERKAKERQEELKQEWKIKVQNAHADVSVKETFTAEIVSMSKQAVWFLFALFELEEHYGTKGEPKSGKSAWFDRSAPRANGSISYKGLTGFTSRMATKHPDLFALSGNGYVYCRAKALGLVMHLREFYPELTPNAESKPGFPFVMEQHEDIELLNASWRSWFTTM